jgi:hypothetical protein
MSEKDPLGYGKLMVSAESIFRRVGFLCNIVLCTVVVFGGFWALDTAMAWWQGDEVTTNQSVQISLLTTEQPPQKVHP